MTVWHRVGPVLRCWDQKNARQNADLWVAESKMFGTGEASPDTCLYCIAIAHLVPSAREYIILKCMISKMVGSLRNVTRVEDVT